MPTVDVDDIEIEVYCSCGNGLCNQTTYKHTYRRLERCFIVDPCENCLEKAREKARDAR